MNGVQNGILSGFESFRDITFINTFAGLISSPLMIFGAFYFGLTGLTITLLISRVINVFINSIYLQKNYKNFRINIKAVLTKEKLKPIFGISLPSFLSSMATSPINWVSTTIFVNQPMGYNSLGIYNAANQLRQLVLFLPDSAGKVSIPTLANAFGNGDLKKFKITVLTTFLWNLVLSLGPAIVIFFFSGIFKNYIGKEFIISTDLVLIVLITGILVALTNAIGYIFICSNLIWYDFILRIFWGISLIALLLLFGRNNGVIGYATSILGASVIHMIVQICLLLIKFSFKKH
ncbi:Polysaccharide biosynthesis protein [compost metagenome]